jgi:predicted metal-dependent hydrolase
MDTAHREGDCSQAPPELLLSGIEEFNRGEWFDCHETLEDLWIGEPGLVRDLYQGILQVGVALHHWREGNHGGAVLLLRNGVKLLRHMAPDCQRVDVAKLIEDSERLREELEKLGPERMSELEAGLIPRIRMLENQSTING